MSLDVGVPRERGAVGAGHPLVAAVGRVASSTPALVRDHAKRVTTGHPRGVQNSWCVPDNYPTA
jgi:hypothetical protein